MRDISSKVVKLLCKEDGDKEIFLDSEWIIGAVSLFQVWTDRHAIGSSSQLCSIFLFPNVWQLHTAELGCHPHADSIIFDPVTLYSWTVVV